MVHGLCGELNRNSLCTKDEKCTKPYPKPFLNETVTGEDGYSKRRSPEQGRFTAKIKIRSNEEIQVNN